MAKLKCFSQRTPTCPGLMQAIVSSLFPAQQETDGRDVSVPDLRDIPPVTAEELLEASRRIGNSKTPGPDGIPNVALKTAIRARPELFMEVYNTCLLEGIFPKRWKLQRLVLLPKGQKPPKEPSSYRPLCMLDSAGKILERIIYNRLEKAVEQAGDLAAHQYGFRKARSTVDAISVIVDTARQAITGKRWRGGAKKYCAVVTLDIKNAFNTARWSCIHDKLQRLEVPAYIRRISRNYPKDRILIYDTNEGPKKYNITGGVPQGSVLGPLLWNIMYDDILRLPIPEEAKIIGFADDVALLIVAKYREEVIRISGEAVTAIQEWLGKVGLQLAAHKTEAVLITGRKKRETVTLLVGNHEIESKPCIRYLGVMIDARLTFKDHLEHVSSKASNVNAALMRIMPNIGGARSSRRRLLASVINSIMMYGAPIWANAMIRPYYRRKMFTVQRLCALRVISAYRTVSHSAALVIAGMVPCDLLAEERHKLYHVRDANQRETMTDETLNRWQQRWSEEEHGRWTYRLIPNIRLWIERRHGEVNFYLSQVLTGHGCFRAYLHRFKLDEKPDCTDCGVPEDVEHVVFHCKRYQNERSTMEMVIGQHVTPENIVSHMLSTEAKWKAVQVFAGNIMKELRNSEQARKAELNS